MKELLEGFLSRLETETTPKEGEYLGDDGLLYCGKCHTPVQCRKELFGKMRILPCTCRCRQEEMRRQKEADEARERMNTIHRLKATGIQERHLLDWRFDVAEETDTIRWAKHYVENWRKVRDKNLGLLLWGDVGTGKSFAAACIANVLLEQAVPVLMTNFSRILNQMGAMYTEERYQYIASFNHYSLLIIDDLGIERSTEYAKEQVYAVIGERYKANLPLIITTNLTIRELRNPATVADARIYSRVLEMCTPVQVSGGDRRQAVSRQKQELVKDVLFSGKGGEVSQ
ncbi:ATP-binding protein [Porcincola intestinalis]|uniref:ATP-binding protein n=1 Tax=Porcincola intestinalis TaxID=2606632 RepID=A0A6L5X919_9FIRM|nr:ATP-binding protein [Porcincola intestinalis]MSS15935.1 ATP-binding protein [Porcincola intestinalis]